MGTRVTPEMLAALEAELGAALAPESFSEQLQAQSRRYLHGPAGRPQAADPLEQALVAALVEMLATMPKQALERAGKAEEQEFALRLARESAAAEGARAENVARIGAEASRYQADQELAGKRAEQSAKAAFVESDPERQAQRIQLDELRRKQAVEREFGTEIPMEARRGFVERMRELADAETFPAQKVQSAGNLVDEIRARYPGRSGDQLAKDLGDVLTQELYDVRPWNYTKRGELADEIIKHKERLYGPGKAGVTREQLTGYHLTGGLRRPWWVDEQAAPPDERAAPPLPVLPATGSEKEAAAAAAERLWLARQRGDADEIAAAEAAYQAMGRAHMESRGLLRGQKRTF
jgi:hypothetical protein